MLTSCMHAASSPLDERWQRSWYSAPALQHEGVLVEQAACLDAPDVRLDPGGGRDTGPLIVPPVCSASAVIRTFSSARAGEELGRYTLPSGNVETRTN